MNNLTYSVYRSNEVQYYLNLIPCRDAAHPYYLLFLTCSLFPVPCSLKFGNCVPHSYENCYNRSRKALNNRSIGLLFNNFPQICAALTGAC